MEKEIIKNAVKVETAIKSEIDYSKKTVINVTKHITNRKRFSRFLRILGPGLVTGAADDDPSGIATYSQAGASFGFGLLWAFPLMYPLLLSVQETCARIGAVTGRGLASVLKENYSKKVLYTAVGLVVVANTINIGSDLGAMASATQLIVPLPYGLLAVLYAAIILVLVIFVNYKTYARILKWLAIVLLAYPITAFLVGVSWSTVFKATFFPHISITSASLYILVGMLGTTISPYLFFWDTSEVVEDEIAKHRLNETTHTPIMNKHFLKSIRTDNFVGMTLATVTAWFIVIVCATVLFSQGTTNINSAADAAKALEPLVKNFPDAGLIAKLLFSVGVIGIGLLAVPVLAGSSSYAISEALGWKEGLHRKFKRAHGFYGVIIAATLVGLAINFLHIDPIKALVFTAVFNGISAVPLLFMIAKVGNNKKIMGEYVNGKLSNFGVRTAFVVMSVAVLLLFISFIK